MYNYACIDSFIFDRVTYDSYHHGNLMGGLTHNAIMHLKKGTAKIETADKVIELKEGEAAIIPKGTRYNAYLCGSPEIEFYSYLFLNCPDNIENVPLQRLIPGERAAELSDELMSSDKSGSRALGLFFLFLDELLEKVEFSPLGTNHPVLEKATRYMILNPSCRISDVAEHCNMSESGLYLLFKNTAATTPAKLKMQLQLQKAYNYLAATDIPVEEVSDICGFSSSSYFRKNFKNFFQKTPSQVRKPKGVRPLKTN